MVHGDIAADTVVLGGDLRIGSVAVGALDGSVDVTFSAAMPDAGYNVLLFMSGATPSLTITAQATTGFTINFTPGLTGLITYLAAESV